MNGASTQTRSFKKRFYLQQLKSKLSKVSAVGAGRCFFVLSLLWAKTGVPRGNPRCLIWWQHTFINRCQCKAGDRTRSALVYIRGRSVNPRTSQRAQARSLVVCIMILDVFFLNLFFRQRDHNKHILFVTFNFVTRLLVIKKCAIMRRAQANILFLEYTQMLIKWHVFWIFLLTFVTLWNIVTHLTDFLFTFDRTMPRKICQACQLVDQ